MAYTPEQEQKIQLVRLLIGDSPGSPFYPLFDDDEIAQLLELNNWNVRRATRMAAIAASMNFAQMAYRERTGDIEVWNNVSIQYLKALENIINENTVSNFGVLVPYFGGIDWCTVEGYKNDPNNVRSDLVKVRECSREYIPGAGFNDGRILIVVNTDEDGNQHGSINP